MMDDKMKVRLQEDKEMKNMNITFFIGNGFDINLGLHTKYSEFYPYFMEHARKDNMIKRWINESEQPWADLEEKLGKELAKLAGNEVDYFYEDKEELDTLLLEYLEKEQRRYCFGDNEVMRIEFTRSMLNFYDEMPTNDANSLKSTMEKYKNEEYIYSYITFNYTDVLDRIIDSYGNTRVISNHQGNTIAKANRIGKVIHIHGTTNEEMILGVNDEGQIDNEFLKLDDMFLDTFIKRRMNYHIGQRKTESAIDMLSKSHIVCVFGMSIGNTDKMWWEEIIKWLDVNRDNKLVVFWKCGESALKRKLPSTLIRLNEKLKREIFEKGKGENDENYYSRIKDRIMISYNSSIFSFPKVIKSKEKI